MAAMGSKPLYRFSQLSVGISRTSIRHGHTRSRYRTTQPSDFAEGHGEQIWVFNHLTSNQIIYSHKPVLDSNRALRQLPFSGKKSKPAKLRKDYWKPMALLEFQEGQGIVGQSVFQKLREFRKMHELCWGDELLMGEVTSDGRRGPTPTKRERGRAIGDQRANAVADMAAVLSGSGRGNKIWVSRGTNAAAKTSTEQQQGQGLAPVTIYWANEEDQEIADWTGNVSHNLMENLSLEAENTSDIALESEPTAPAPAS